MRKHDEDTMRVRESEESGLVFVSVLGSAVFVRRRVAPRRHFDQIDRNVFNFPWNKKKKKNLAKEKISLVLISLDYFSSFNLFWTL